MCKVDRQLTYPKLPQQNLEDFKEALENLYLDHEYLINKVDSNMATIVQHFGDEDLYVKVGVGLIICLYGALHCLFELIP